MVLPTTVSDQHGASSRLKPRRVDRATLTHRQLSKSLVMPVVDLYGLAINHLGYQALRQRRGQAFVACAGTRTLESVGRPCLCWPWECQISGNKALFINQRLFFIAVLWQCCPIREEKNIEQRNVPLIYSVASHLSNTCFQCPFHLPDSKLDTHCRRRCRSTPPSNGWGFGTRGM